MNVLGLDLGTLCGYALSDEIAGTWDLTPRRHEDGGMRLLKFRASLVGLVNQAREAQTPVEVVAYELIPTGAAKGQAAVVLNELLGVLKVTCHDLGLHYTGIPITKVKRCATGKGNANKEAMVQAAEKRWPAFRGDDNEADARFVREAALREIGHIETTSDNGR